MTTWIQVAIAILQALPAIVKLIQTILQEVRSSDLQNPPSVSTQMKTVFQDIIESRKKS